MQKKQEQTVIKMADNTKQYNIDLVNTVSGWDYSTTNRLRCASWSEKQIEKYLRELSAFGCAPKESCFFTVNARFYENSEIKVILPSFFARKPVPGIRDESDGGMDINIKFKNSHKCPCEDCFKNIQSGKCTDKFVIDIIGKKFFTDNYSK